MENNLFQSVALILISKLSGLESLRVYSWSTFFLIYINDRHYAIKFSSPFHFADDTSLLNIQNSIKEISKTLTKDLKELSIWLNANKITLNVTKSKVIFLKQETRELIVI